MPEEDNIPRITESSRTKPETKGLLQRLMDGSIFEEHPSSILIVVILGVIGAGTILGLSWRFVGFISDLPNQPIKQAASNYFVTIKNNYPDAAFGEFKIANPATLTVSDADKANGITDKATITLTFIYRESSSSEWKDAQWKLWLEKKTDWNVVNAQKER